VHRARRRSSLRCATSTGRLGLPLVGQDGLPRRRPLGKKKRRAPHPLRWPIPKSQPIPAGIRRRRNSFPSHVRNPGEHSEGQDISVEQEEALAPPAPSPSFGAAALVPLSLFISTRGRRSVSWSYKDWSGARPRGTELPASLLRSHLAGSRMHC
jgi:hypothetical protein